MIYEIKRGNTVVWSGKPKGSQHRKILQEDRVEMTFDAPATVNFKIGDTVEVYGRKYKLNRSSNISRVNTKVGYSYNIEFEALYYDLGKWILYTIDKNNKLTEGNVHLMSDARTLLGLVLQNANRASSGWTLGQIDDTETFQWGYNSSKLLSVLQDAADKTGLELWFDDKVINLTKRQPETGIVLEYGMNKGLYELFRNRRPNPVTTHLYVYGGTRNLPNDYGFTNIQPAGGNPIVNPNYVAGQDRVEETIVFENIYPRLNAKVTSVEGIDVIRSTDINFDLNTSLLNSGLPAQIVFTSGQLAGFTFAVQQDGYDHATRQVTFNTITDDPAYPGGVPSVLLKPAVGDSFVFLQINMPNVHVDEAQSKVKDLALSYYADEGKEQYDWLCKPTPKFILEQGIEFTLGGLITLKAADIGYNGSIRVDSYVRDLQEPHRYEFTLSNLIGISAYARERNKSDKLADTVNRGLGDGGGSTSETLRTVTARGSITPFGIEVRGTYHNEFTAIPLEAPPADVKEGYAYIWLGDGVPADIPLNTLYDLDDVNVLSVTDGQVLTYSSSQGKWIAKDSQGGGLTEVNWSDIKNKPTTFPPSAHTHDAKDINSGVIAPARLGTGSAGASMVLHGDGTWREQKQGTVTSVGLSAPTGFTVSNSPVTNSGTLSLSFATGYSLPTTAKQSQWDGAVSNIASTATSSGLVIRQTKNGVTTDVLRTTKFPIIDARIPGNAIGSDGSATYFPPPNTDGLDSGMTGLFHMVGNAWRSSLIMKGWFGSESAWSLSSSASWNISRELYFNVGHGSSWGQEVRVWHEGNSRSDAQNDAKYVNKSGDTMTGALTAPKLKATTDLVAPTARPSAPESGSIWVGDGVAGEIPPHENYVLPTATATELGGIKVGSGLTINASTGVLSANGDGSVKSVGLTAPTGFTVSNSPVTSSGTLSLSFASGYSLPTTAKQAAWDGKQNNIPAGTTAQYWRGDKTWQPLNKSAVGLSNVDNTSDANKPVSNAQQTAIDAKANRTVKITGVGSIGGGGDLTADRTIDLTASAKADIAKGVQANGWGDHDGKYFRLGDNTSLNSVVVNSGSVLSQRQNLFFANTQMTDRPRGTNATVLSVMGLDNYGGFIGFSVLASGGIMYNKISEGVPTGWREVWDENNLRSNAQNDAKYVSKSGDTMTGALIAPDLRATQSMRIPTQRPPSPQVGDIWIE